MEVENKLAMTEQIANAALGTVQGVATGASAGMMIGGGPIGAVVGGAVGGVMSAAGGVADTVILSKRQAEALDYSKDMFNYNLGNIKAQGQTMSKNTGYNINNHYFPFIEYYSCTDIEKEAFKNKIKYNGMTVNVIGNISQYLQDDYSYIKAKLIRIENISDDFHIFAELANEMNMGVYIK